MIRIGKLIAALLLIGLPLADSALSAPPSPAASPVPMAPGELIGAVPVSMTIANSGDSAETLIGGFTPVAERVELHTTRLIDGQREMQLALSGIVIPPRTTRILEPGAAHLMLVGLREGLVQGHEFPLTLVFQDGGAVTVQVRVRRKVDAAGLTPIPPVVAGNLRVWLASAPPAPGPAG